MYFCPGACHAPHHAPKEWIEKYKGKFDMGYDKYREIVFERQKKMGILPQDAELTPANPYVNEKSVDGKPWNPLDVTRPWDSLSADEKKLFTRMAEVYAGFLSHTDYHIGRLLDYLEEAGQLDNTIIVLVSDNGASGEGGPNGSVNENKFFNGIPDTHRGEHEVPGRAGQPRDLQPLPHRLGLGVQHPLQDVEALQLRRRRGRPDAGLLAQGDPGQRRGAPPVQPRHRHRAHHLRVPGRGNAGGGQGLYPEPTRRHQLQVFVREGRRP